MVIANVNKNNNDEPYLQTAIVMKLQKEKIIYSRKNNSRNKILTIQLHIMRKKYYQLFREPNWSLYRAFKRALILKASIEKRGAKEKSHWTR